MQLIKTFSRRSFGGLATASVFATGTTVTAQARAGRVVPGLDVLLGPKRGLLAGKRVGLITNPTGVTVKLESAIDRMAQARDFKLAALFGPEHGVRGDAQAGAAVADRMDARTGLPAYSLYGTTRKPTPAMLAGLDVLVFDIQDIGVRFYTYPWTLALVMQAAREAGMGVIVADRPNPIGGIRVEGPVLDPALASFVGAYPIPIRHGMTLGELALMMNTDFGIGCDLTVVTCTNWRRPDDATQTGLPWVPPSPNMPTIDTAFIYPGTCLIEGTNLSEGRGTTKPFELIGAPFIDAHGLADRLNPRNLPGAHFRPAWFTPSFSKFQGQLCAGVQVHITDRAAFAPVDAGIAILLEVARHHGKDFSFLPGNPPFFDKLAGASWLREAITAGESLDAIKTRWQPELAAFKLKRARRLLY
ncbi:exo-beta-N-acetylmuramidase NamZ domain-containing protein [Aquidulcibacter sp.]|uniref:exo-beta-N-acetylmuramidase NamZ family protein n=1 Tax=Aquidulcibacter sp. TaxID=2052990 RepID=UPI0037838DED